jgi:AraC-like DNA-binding protein
MVGVGHPTGNAHQGAGILPLMSRPVLHNDPIPFITLPNWVKAAAHCGFNIEPVFKELGITTDLLNVETATIERPLLIAAMERCVTLARHHHFPFVLGETFDFDYLPDLETFITTSPTLREASHVFVWVRELINPMLEVTLEEEGDTARLVLRFAGLDEAMLPKPWFSETMFASILKFGRMLLGEDMPFTVLRFRHPPPPHVAVYEPFFRVPIRFDQSQYAVEYPRALLDQPLANGFPAMHEQARQRVDRRLRALPRRGGLIASVEQACQRRPALLGQGIGAVAEELGLHPRTLQRRLHDEGERYADLQDRLRYRLAMQYLADPALDIEAVSEKLGFSDRRSFTRAFSRWSGVTPSEYRKRG